MSDTSKKRGKHKTAGPKLSARDVKFCKLLFDGKSQYEAFVTAYGAKETREATDVAAHRNVRNRKIREFLRELQTRAATVAQLDADRLVEGLMRIAFANRGDLFDDCGRLLPKDKWPADVAQTVEGIENEELYEFVAAEGEPKRRELRGYKRKVKTAPRLPAFRLLAEILRLVGRDAEVEEMAREIAELRSLLQRVQSEGRR